MLVRRMLLLLNAPTTSRQGICTAGEQSVSELVSHSCTVIGCVELAWHEEANSSSVETVGHLAQTRTQDFCSDGSR
jgi:hypothetical protein